MAATVQFLQAPDPKGQGTALYETRVPGSVGWAAFLVMNANIQLPPVIGIKDSLTGNYGGAYIFAASRPDAISSDPVGFINAARNYINKSVSGGNRAAFWLQDINPYAFGSFAAFGFAFGTDINLKYVINTNLNAQLGSNLIFNLNQSLYLTADEANGQLVASFTGSSIELISLQSGSSYLGIKCKPLSAQIPLSGGNTGCVVFAGTMTPSVTFAPPPKTGLTQGLQYAYNSGGTARTIFYPAFDVNAWPQTLSIIVTVDPSDPANTRIQASDLQKGYLRTAVVFTGSPSLPAYFQTTQGNALNLIPVGAAAGAATPPPMAGALAMASASPAGTGPGGAQIYLAPAGTFAASATSTPAGQPVNLLCGLFGSECLTFATYESSSAANDCLFFLASQPAFAPIFPFETANLQNSGSGSLQPRLTADYVTSWATVLFSGQGTQTDVLYQAQPEGSPLYALPASSEGPIPVLVSAPPLMPLTGSPQNTFPLAPYAQAPSSTAGGNVLTQYESQIIAPTRKLIISASALSVRASRAQARARSRTLRSVSPVPLGPTPLASGAGLSTSPQGFLVTSDTTSGAYLNVQLAQSVDPDSGALIPFAFTDPSQQLEEALQTNQLFLVAVNNQYIQPFASLANVAGWKLSAEVGAGVTPTSYRNVMILKFCSGSLQDRVTNPNRWTSASEFSLAAGSSGSGDDVAYAGLSQWLQAYIANGISEASGPSAAFYKNFTQIVTDPDWNGVIVLQADLSPQDLPLEIAGLAAGIDFSRFNAHHFGFTVSRVLPYPSQNPPLQMDGPSSFFGLIDYQDPTYQMNLANNIDPNTPIPVAASGDLQFTVLLLQVLFENAKIANFKSNVQLTVNALLGSKVVQTIGNARPGVSNGTPMPANGIVLDGSYVSQEGAGSAASAYVFQQTNTSVFRLNSNVLQAAAFNSIQFNTLGTDSSGLTTSRFLVWGAFDFTQMKDQNGGLFDVLSFGSATGTSALQLGAGLSFSNFMITMSSYESTPNAQLFEVTADNLAYDLNASLSRADSLFKGFGLQLKSFVNVSGDKTPLAFGFLPVTSSLNLKSLTPPWYGVVYQVTLGGPGALASSVGFDSNLLIAWSPSTVAGDQQQSVFIGLSLPGASPGAKLFSLQGVIKVAVGSISLLRQAVQGGNGDMFYCLRLDDIAIKIFGIAKLPPDANIQFFLFGDPKSTGSTGWYAAYVDQSSSQNLATPALQTGADAARLLLAPADAPQSGGDARGN
jgi:hypothetical protein